MSLRKFETSEFNQLMGIVKIFEAIEKFKIEQILLGQESILYKLCPKDTTEEQIKKTLSDFVKFCVPDFLVGQKNIYEKLLHEKMTQSKQNQMRISLSRLNSVHSTLSTRGMINLQDIDLSSIMVGCTSSSKPPLEKKRDLKAKAKLSSVFQPKEIEFLGINNPKQSSMHGFQKTIEQPVPKRSSIIDYRTLN